jgi:hypothetical protein
MNKLIIWGHFLHSHTHSYVHQAFYKASVHLGMNTHWFDDTSDVTNFDFSNSIFITEGQVDKKIPIRDDCFYVLHNCYDEKYKELFKNNKCMNLQVYTDTILKYNYPKLDECIYADYEGKCLYFPWATDLLPDEIEKNKPTKPFNYDSKEVNWVGTIGAGEFGNINEITPFKDACQVNGINFNQTMLVSFEKNVSMIKDSYLAPTITGTWQTRVGYIPCRIFKNISYGQMGLTNSVRVASLFNNKIIQNSNTKDLFYDSKNYINSMPLKELHDLMDVVKEKHTYVNRLNSIIDFMDKIK